MSQCNNCGDDLEDPRDKDNKGWWRDKCMPCIGEAVPEIDSEPIIKSNGYQEWLKSKD